MVEPEALPISKTRKHRWGDGVPISALGRNDQTERTCIHCGMLKITVHSPQGLPWREWRHSKSPAQFACEHTPPCLALETTVAA